jgi:glycosyltransferase involved in cell wall biosynthesis
VFTFSEALRRSFIDDFGLCPERVVTVYAGANLEAEPLLDIAKGSNGGASTILFVGREFERKGGPQLLAAFKKIVHLHPRARLVIAGANPAIENVPGVEVVGFIDRTSAGRARLKELYRSADLFCLPSLYEAFGIVFIEAMLHGLPCIGTRTCAIPEIIDDGVSGWLVPPADVDALAEVLAKALGNPAVLRGMGASGYAKAVRHFTWSNVSARMCEHMFGQEGFDVANKGNYNSRLST